MDLIAISGKMCAGKTSTADYLCANYGFKKMFFADPLKFLARKFVELCSLERDMIANKVPLRERLSRIDAAVLAIRQKVKDLFPDDPYLELVATPALFEVFSRYWDMDITVEKNDLYRALLQNIGTALRGLRTDVWTDYLVNQARKEIAGGARIVVDDMRYKNEYDGLKKAGFTTVRVDVRRDIQMERITHLYGGIEESRLSHPSEIDLDDVKFDYRLDGNIHIKDMYRQIDAIMGG